MRVIGNLSFQPVKISHLGLGTTDNHEGRLGEARDREIRLDAASVVEPLGVDHPACGDIHVIGANPIQYRHRVAAFKAELGEGRLIEQRNALAHSTMLCRRVLKPVLSAVAVFIFRLNACGGIPVGALPTKGLAMAGTDRRESVMDG